MRESRPQQRCSVSSCGLPPLASLVASARLLFGLPLVLLPSLFLSVPAFSRTSCLLRMCPDRTAAVLSLSPPALFQALGPTRSS